MKGERGKRRVVRSIYVHDLSAEYRSGKTQRRGKRRAEKGECRLQFSSHPIRGSSLVSIKPSAFTAGAALSDPGGFEN